MNDIETLFNAANADQKKLIMNAVKTELDKRHEHTMANLEKFVQGTTDVALSDFYKTHSRKEKAEKKTLKPKSDLIRLIPDKDSQKFLRENVLKFIREKDYISNVISDLLKNEYEIELTVTKDDSMIFKHGEVEIERKFDQLVDGAYPFKMFFSLISNTFKQKGVELKPFKESLLSTSLQEIREKIYDEMKV